MSRSLFHTVSAYALLTAALVGYGFWYSLIEERSAAVAHLEDQLILKTETANRVAAVRASLTELEGDEAALRNYFVPEAGVVAFINELEAQGRDLGATITVASVSMSNENTQPTLIFTIAVKGSFDAVLRAAGAIEFAPYALSISSFALQKRTDGAWHADLTFRVGSTPSHAPSPAV